MHLSILSPTTLLPGVPGGIVGGLTSKIAPLVGLLTVQKKLSLFLLQNNLLFQVEI